MKVIIAGSRGIYDMNVLHNAINSSRFEITEVVSGGARGVDRLGEVYANHKNIDLKVFPADWDKHGRKAGPIRNAEMAEYADALIAIWDGESRGTANMIQQARKNGLDVFIYLVREHE